MKTKNPLTGKRIMLIYVDDKYTHLKCGDLGTVTDVHKQDWFGDHFIRICVNWDSGSSLMLIAGKDQFEVIEQ